VGADRQGRRAALGRRPLTEATSRVGAVGVSAPAKPRRTPSSAPSIARVEPITTARTLRGPFDYRLSEELRAEVELIRAMGFNAVRVHQKAEDPRFLFWADRLGLMVWAETAAAYVYSATAVTLLVTEWMDLVRRDRSHPAVVVWVPVNESWGVPDITSSPAQQNFARSLASLTRALDPSRPVVSNEGWEHVDSDILGLSVQDVGSGVLAFCATLLGLAVADRSQLRRVLGASAIVGFVTILVDRFA